MAHALAALYFLNLRGDVLIERRYRDDVERDVAEAFRTQVLNSKDGGGGGGAAARPPVCRLGSVSCVSLRHGDVYALAATRNNANAMLALSFMAALLELLRSYFGGPVDEGALKRNFTLVYELLDEAMDFGLPQLTDPGALKGVVLQRGVRGDGGGGGGLGKKGAKQRAQKQQAAIDAQSATLTVTGAVPWRREGVRYRTNEVFLDVVEDVNLLMGHGGAVLRCDVVGRVLMKARLSGMPELRLGLADRLEDVTFHQCVNLGAYEAQRVVTFVPPDGDFELLRYRATDGVAPPFRAVPAVKELGRTRLEAGVAVRSLFSAQLFALGVVVLVPVPDNTARAQISVTAGKAKYDATKKAIVWKIRRFPGDAEHALRADVSLVAPTRSLEAKPWGRPPISLSFSVPMFSASGMRVAYLKVMERRLGADYKVDKWVRKVTRSGDYLVRTTA